MKKAIKILAVLLAVCFCSSALALAADADVDAADVLDVEDAADALSDVVVVVA